MVQKFRACINDNHYFFDFKQLLTHMDSIVWTWLCAGNQPDRLIGRLDRWSREICENDILKVGVDDSDGPAETARVIWDPQSYSFKLEGLWDQNPGSFYDYDYLGFEIIGRAQLKEGERYGD